MRREIEISGAECVAALLLDGFHVQRRMPGATTLRRAGHLVIVPDTLVLPAAVLDAVLAEAAVSRARFVELLAEEPARGGAPRRALPHGRVDRA